MWKFSKWNEGTWTLDLERVRFDIRADVALFARYLNVARNSLQDMAMLLVVITDVAQELRYEDVVVRLSLSLESRVVKENGVALIPPVALVVAWMLLLNECTAPDPLQLLIDSDLVIVLCWTQIEAASVPRVNKTALLQAVKHPVSHLCSIFRPGCRPDHDVEPLEHKFQELVQLQAFMKEM